MDLDLENFNPNDVDELGSAISDELSKLGKKWWSTNSGIVNGYVKSLAEATMQTQIALASGKINAEQADRIIHMQELAFSSTLHFTKYMTFVLAQNVLDTTFSIVGWAFYNRTGVNLFPQLVKP